jgi:hypothetical protein
MEFSTFDYGKSVEESINKVILSSIPCLTICNSIYYNSRLGKNTEIDILIVTRHGLYSIECKGYTGALTGEFNMRKWLGQSGRKGGLSIYNPIMQNFMHIRCLRNFLFSSFGEWYDIRNYVVVPDKTKIYTDNEFVIHQSTLRNILQADCLRYENKYDIDLLLYRLNYVLCERTG